MADNDAEKLNQAIKLTQKLRSNVTKVFTDLSDGFHNTQGNEKKLLGELQKYLLAVNDSYRCLFTVFLPVYRLHNSVYCMQFIVDQYTHLIISYF